MRSYETARRLFPIIEVICAGVFALGFIVFIFALVNAGEFFSLQYFLTGSAAILGLFLSFVADPLTTPLPVLTLYQLGHT